jgi:hypothetical protein
MSHEKAPPETQAQIDCREWWQKRMISGSVGWGRDRHGKFFAQFARDAQAAWEAAMMSTVHMMGRPE